MFIIKSAYSNYQIEQLGFVQNLMMRAKKREKPISDKHRSEQHTHLKNTRKLASTPLIYGALPELGLSDNTFYVDIIRNLLEYSRFY